ncbi:MAG: hypothetical protein HY925_06520 [Elusimicrobia bacterium]|nr:hypothetical protein [Elusimicrobiota bacterium]
MASFFFHASLTWAGETLDVLGMYLVVGFLLVHGLGLRRRWFAFLAALSTAVLVSDAGHALRRPLFGVLTGGLLLAELRPTVARDRRLLFAALAVFLLAFGIWTLDQRKIVCSPESLLQGHAVWHLLCAGSLALLYRYYQEA